MRTGPSKRTFGKTYATEPFSPASLTTVTKNSFVVVQTIIQVKHALPLGKKTGNAGNLFTPATRVCPAGSCAYRRRSFGVTAGYGVITQWRCSALFTVCI